MSNQQKKHMAYTIVTLLICFGIAAVNVILILKINQVSRLIKETRESLSQWQKREVYSRELTEEYEKFKPDLMLVNNGFLPPDQIVGFIEKLEDLSRNHQITQEIKQADKKEESAELVLNLVLEGNFLNTLRYLAFLENLDNYTKIDRLKIDAAPKTIASDTAVSTLAPSLKTNLEFIVFLVPTL